jgi:hypothetical protein
MLDCNRARKFRCGKKLKLISDGGDHGSKKKAVRRLWWRLWWGLVESAFGGVWNQAVGFVLVRLAGIWLQSVSKWRFRRVRIGDAGLQRLEVVSMETVEQLRVA